MPGYSEPGCSDVWIRALSFRRFSQRLHSNIKDERRGAGQSVNLSVMKQRNQREPRISGNRVIRRSAHQPCLQQREREGNIIYVKN